MDTKKLKGIVFSILCIGIIAFNKDIMPVRKEITELELSKTIGMDSINEGKYRFEQTVARLYYQKANAKIPESIEDGDIAEEFSVKFVTFNDGIRSFQTYTEGSLTGAHLRFFLLGEEMLKGDESLGVDFNLRDPEVRLNAGVYIIKDMKAKEFINKVQNKVYSIDKKIVSMEKNNEAKSVSDKLSVLEFMNILLEEEIGGLIPTLKTIPSEEEQKKEYGTKKNYFESAIMVPDKSNEVFFDFGGYAIIQNSVIIGYLDRSDSTTTNIIKNTAKGTNMNIETDDGGMISFGIIKTKTDISFEFDRDKLKKVIIKSKVHSNFDEVITKENVFTSEKIKELIIKQEIHMKEAIEQVIKQMVEYKCDFLGIKEKARMKHPYKFKKMESNWNEELCNAEFEVITKCNIDRTYDILALKYEGGDNQ